MNTIGILALQGCVEPHAEHLRRLGASVRYIRQSKDLPGIEGLILPGGESTTMLKLAQKFGLWEELQKLSEEIPFWGICAGAILMAKSVDNPAQASLGVIDIAVRRNAYGRQIDSFQQEIELTSGSESAPAVFIRAPKFLSWGSAVRVAGKVKGDPVFLESELHMVTAFHPELTTSSWCHERFLTRIRKR